MKRHVVYRWPTKHLKGGWIEAGSGYFWHFDRGWWYGSLLKYGIVAREPGRSVKVASR